MTGNKRFPILAHTRKLSIIDEYIKVPYISKHSYVVQVMARIAQCSLRWRKQKIPYIDTHPKIFPTME